MLFRLTLCTIWPEIHICVYVMHVISFHEVLQGSSVARCKKMWEFNIPFGGIQATHGSVDIRKEHIADNFEVCIWEPAVINFNGQ